MTINAMETTVRELRELTRMREELDAEITALQDSIKAAMGQQEQVLVGEYKIMWKPVTSHRVDTASLKKLMPDVVAQFTKTTTTRRFQIC